MTDGDNKGEKKEQSNKDWRRRRRKKNTPFTCLLAVRSIPDAAIVNMGFAKISGFVCVVGDFLFETR